MIFRDQWSSSLVAGVLTGAVMICCTVGYGYEMGVAFRTPLVQGPETVPTWWKDRGVTDPTKPEANKSVVTIGQLKWATRQLHEELNSLLPPEAELFDLEESVPGSPSALDVVMPYEEGSAEWKRNNSTAATIGQLKNSTFKFYDKLNEISSAWVSEQLVRNGLPNDGRSYPWTSTTTDDLNKAPITIGQLKNVFSLRLRESLDDDLLPDLFEHALIKYVPEFYGKSLQEITWKPGDAVVSILPSGPNSQPIRTNVAVPNFGGVSSNGSKASDLLAEHQPVGSVGGAFLVGGDGSANYNIPLKIPKGTAGVEPAIAIGYTSSGGNGSLGVGFDITGFERITRGPTSRLKDGFLDPVDFDGNDRFFFNGELLIALTNANGDPATASDYGKDGTVYQTEKHSFARIMSHGQTGSGPHHWTIQTKGGLTIELGNCATSCVVAPSAPGALVWNVNKVSDNVGNYYKVEYQLDANGGPMDYRLARVKYTGNGAMAPYNEVHFVWEDRLDVMENYIHGIKVSNGKRLARVDVYGLQTLLHSYNFGYDPYHAKNSPSRLVSVTQSLPGGEALPPTLITWASETIEPDISGRSIWFKSSKAEFNQPQWTSGDNHLSTLMDMNGDGLVDKVSYFNPDKPDSYQQFFNITYENDNYHGIWVALNNGTGFEEQTMWFKPMQAVGNYPTNYYAVNYRELAKQYSYPKFGDKAGFYDVNGDGLPDRVMDLNVAHTDFVTVVRTPQGPQSAEYDYNYNPASTGMWVALNTGTGFGELKRWYASERREEGQLVWKSGNTSYSSFVDMNGDGLPDRINHRNYDLPGDPLGIYVSLNTGSEFSSTKILWGQSVRTEENYATWASGETIYSGLIDMNGDGLLDKVDHYNYANTSDGYGIYVSLNDGVGSFGTKQKWLTVTRNEQACFSWGDYSGFLDINRDGLPDRVDHYDYSTGTPGIWVTINTGSGFLPKQKWLADTDSNYCCVSYNNAAGEYYAGFYDLNGDGLVDRVRYTANGPQGTGLYVALNKGSFSGGSGFAGYTKWFDSPATKVNYPAWGSGSTQYSGFADMNGDGLLDRFSHTDPVTGQGGGNIWVAINNGSGFDEGQPSPGFAATAPPQKSRIWYTSQKTEQGYLGWADYSQMLDMDGDGLMDRVDHHNYQTNRPTNEPAAAMWVSLNKGRGFNERSTGRIPQPAVTQITDGLGAVIKVEYKYGSRASLDDWGRPVYTKPAFSQTDADAGIIHISGAGYLVSRYAEQDGLGGFRWKRQYYGCRKVDRTSGKDLGFGWTETVDEQRMKGQITTYYQDSVKEGLSKESVSYLTSGAQKIVVERQTSTYAVHPEINGIGGKVRFVYSDETTSYSYAPEGPHAAVLPPAGVPGLSGFVGNLLSSETNKNINFDSDGNLTASSTSTSDGFSTASTFIYDPAVISGGRWILGRLRSSTVTRAGPTGYTAVPAKTSVFEYYTEGTFEGMLKSETAQPADPLAVRKSYTYDAWGNKNSVTVEAINETSPQPSRTSYSTYSTTGRFVVEESNQLNHKTTYRYDEARSLLLSTTDANGLTAETFYDAWGTRILSRGPDGSEVAEISRYAVPADVPAGTGLDPQKVVFIRKSQSSGKTSATAYLDAQGKVLMTSAESFDGRMIYSRADYDALGRQWRKSIPFFIGDPVRWAWVEFDGSDRPVVNHNPDGSRSSVSYQGLATVMTNEKAQHQTNVANARGWLMSTTDNRNNVTNFSYDVDGKPTQTVAPGNHTVDVTLDAFGNKTSMTDSDVGTSITDFFAFGEIRKITDGEHTTTEYTYDALGRQKTRSIKKAGESSGSLTTWTYDTAPGAGKGKIHTVVLEDGVRTHSTSYRYDKLGRTVETVESQFGETFRSSATYDALGRPRTETDAGGLTILHEYDERGFETGIRNYLTGELYWKPLEYDASGRLLREELGNGVVNKQTFDQDKGTLVASEAKKESAYLQRMSYEWDVLGNFTKRTDVLQSLVEDFTYDNLNRLTGSQVVGRAALSYGYSENGNLVAKTNIGTYTYRTDRTHAIASIADPGGLNRSFEYDDNGALTSESRNGQLYREIEWAAHPDVRTMKVFGGPRLLRVNGTEIFAAGATVMTFDYDSSLARSRKVTERDQLSRETTLYLGSYERIVTEFRASLGSSYSTQKVEHRHSIGGLALKTFTEQGGSLFEETLYYLKDHIGSLSATLDQAGALKERYSFDAWGARRDATTWADSRYDQLTKPDFTNRGFTGHEMLDEIGLVHMNGRIYDPELGRVLSGDPLVQDPTDSQNYNRYSYVSNNPLSLTDPSGFFFLGKKIFDAKKKLHSKINEHRKSIRKKVTKWLAENEWAAVVVAVVVGIVTMGIGTGIVAAGMGAAASVGAGITGAFVAIASGTIGAVVIGGTTIALGFAGGVMAAAIGGFMAGGINAALAGGDFGDVLKGAFVGGIQGAISTGVLHPMQPAAGNAFSLKSAAHIAAHGVVGGTANAAMGGKFQDGFLSAAVSAAAGNLGLLGPEGGGAAGVIRRTAMAGVIGGTASVLGGGKFANGAYTAAFQHLLNNENWMSELDAMSAPAGDWMAKNFGSTPEWVVDLGEGAGATLDGWVPFGDPIGTSGGYDYDDSRFGVSRFWGEISRDAALAAFGSASWAGAGGPTANIAVGAGKPFHVAYGVTRGGVTTWVHASGNVLGRLRVTNMGAAQYVETSARFVIRGIPVLKANNVVQTGQRAWTCVTAAARGVARGWRPW